MVRQRVTADMYAAEEKKSCEDPPALTGHQKYAMEREYEMKRRAQVNQGSGGLFGTVVRMVCPSSPKNRNPYHSNQRSSIRAYVTSLLAISGFVIYLYYANTLNSQNDGPPSNLFITGKRKKYTPVPQKYRKKAWVGTESDSHLPRAFRSLGWDVSNKPKDFESGKFHFLFNRRSPGKESFAVGEPWQRYSRIPNSSGMESKDGFLKGFRDLQSSYEQQQISLAQSGDRPMPTKFKDQMYFIPETYRLKIKSDRDKFKGVLEQDKALGEYRPWVLKKVRLNNGKGIEMIPPNSPALYSAVDRSIEDEDNDYIIQSYICNELTWFNGEKFDLRFYWIVASVDPLMVMYHDGYARVAGAKYNESDWQSTDQHLTNHAYRTTMDEDVLADAFWRRIQQHYDANESRLSQLLPTSAGGDPVKHVRNQMKEAIGALSEAFKDNLSGKNFDHEVTTENLFALYGADFIIDQDLDVWFVEAQAAPGMGDGYDYRVQLFRQLLRPMINIVEEIATKQETAPNTNLWPLKSLEDYHLVYAQSEARADGSKTGGGTRGNRGDSFDGNTYYYRYTYEGYERSHNKKGCELSPK